MENQNNIVLYINGQPIAACTEINLTDFEPPDCTEVVIGKEYTFEVSGFLKDTEWTFEQNWNFNWYSSMWLPRKQKKAYRKKLMKMVKL